MPSGDTLALRGLIVMRSKDPEFTRTIRHTLILSALADGADLDQATGLVSAVETSARLDGPPITLAITGRNGWRSPFDWRPSMRTARAAAHLKTWTWAPLAPGLV